MAIAGFISLWLNRIQPFIVLLSVLLVNVMFSYFAPVEQVSVAQSILFPIVSFLLPFNVFLWVLLPEKGIHNKSYNVFVLTVFAVQAFAVYWLMNELPLQWIEWLSMPVVTGVSYYQLSFASSLMFLVAGFLLSLKLNYEKQLRVFNHSVVFILLLMAFALNQHIESGVLAWTSTVVGLIILLSLVFDAHHIAYTDELTGLKGRRALIESFMGLGKRYSLAMVDIDHFKQFNDTYGHDVGDKVLRVVAKTLDTVNGGKAYRYGGEEFTLVFARKTPEEVVEELDRLRLAVAHQIITLDDKESKKSKKAAKTVNVNISLGVAQPDAEHTTPEQVMKFADEGLYKAKRTGRNKVVISKPKAAAKSSTKTAKAKKS